MTYTYSIQYRMPDDGLWRTIEELTVQPYIQEPYILLGVDWGKSVPLTLSQQRIKARENAEAAMRDHCDVRIWEEPNSRHACGRPVWYNRNWL